MNKTYILKEIPSYFYNNKPRHAFMLLSQFGENFNKVALKFPVNIFFQLRYDINRTIEGDYYIIDVIGYKLPKNNYYCVRKDVIQSYCIEADFESMQLYYLDQSKVIHQERAYLNLKEFVRVASLKNIYDVDQGLMALHGFNSDFRDLITFENDYFRFSYKFKGFYEDIDEISHQITELRCITREFEFIHTSRDVICLKFNDTLIDNCDDDNAVIYKKAMGNYPQEYEKYVECMNKIAEVMSPYAAMTLKELANKPRIMRAVEA